MLTVVRLDRPTEAADLEDRAGAALRAFAACRGFVRGWFGPATDDPALCVFAMEWETVGAYRRALSTYDVKMNAVPLLYLARDEPTAYETVLSATPHGIRRSASDLAPDDARNRADPGHV